jgi:hypothetical protein
MVNIDRKAIILSNSFPAPFTYNLGGKLISEQNTQFQNPKSMEKVLEAVQFDS